MNCCKIISTLFLIAITGLIIAAHGTSNAYAQTPCAAFADPGDSAGAGVRSAAHLWAPATTLDCNTSGLSNVAPGYNLSNSTLYALLNTNGVNGQMGFSIWIGGDFTPDVISAIVNGGAPVPVVILSGNMIFTGVSNATPFSITVQFTQNAAPNAVFHVTFTKNANSNTLNATTLISGPVTSSQSGNLEDQQVFFTPLIMNHQTYNMISGVGSNLDSLFDGNGIAPFVSLSGFSYQSTGPTIGVRNGARQQRQRDQKQPLIFWLIIAVPGRKNWLHMPIPQLT